MEVKMNTVTVDGRSLQMPNMISVDDHVMEPPDLWASRLPKKYLDAGPHVVREKGVRVGKKHWRRDDEGQWADIWHYEDLSIMIPLDLAISGKTQADLLPRAITFDEIRPGCWKNKDRVADMTLDNVDASVCFPNVPSRFCGQTYSEGDDLELGLLCVRAYNDWMIDEWCAGDGYGRLIPLTIVPLWDGKLAADEVRRCAGKGSFAVAFSESPFGLGFKSVHTGEWEPFFAACEETETTVCIHIGSSSRVAKSSPDSPDDKFGQVSPLAFQYGMHSLVDLVLSGTLERYPRLKIAYSEANVGWMPYIMERLDMLWERRKDDPDLALKLNAPPAASIRDRIFGCLVDDAVGVATRDFGLGIDQLTFESDYPHGNSAWPNTIKLGAEICLQTNLNAEEIYKFMRGNAVRAFGLERFGITC